jgi:macrodomain Ter protein organizer (MatP/YcbG family)
MSNHLKRIDVSERAYRRLIEEAKRRCCDVSVVINEMLDVAEAEKRRRGQA